MESRTNRKRMLLSTTQIIVLSFFAAAFVGGILLSLPIAAANGKATPFMDALFTATTSVCVTGLVTVTTAAHWSLFGKIIILMLIQMGGLGITAMAMIIFMMLGRRISIGSRKLLGDTFNMDTLSGIVVFLKKVVFGTLVIEGVGALCCLPVFAAEHGFGKGLWFSVFHSISAFCNAGIDIMGDSSLMPYVSHVWMNLVTMGLIVLGGLGFIVWWDVLAVLRKQKHHLTLHSKIVLTMTGILIFGGTACYLLFEFDNPATIGSMSAAEKLLASLFQSVTTRTAGFAAISQKGLTAGSVIITMILMFIGGSSAGTAGGIKTGTVAVVLIAVVSTVRGQNDINAYGKRIPTSTVRKAMAVLTISALASIIALMLMFWFVDGSAVDIVYEVYSALGTVGLSRDFTSTMNLAGKIIICVCMFLGRIGPMSLILAFTMKNDNEAVRYMEEDVTVG